MNIEELKKCVGMKYQMYDKDGFSLGCSLPVYLLYPDTPRYLINEDNQYEELWDLLNLNFKNVIGDKLQISKLQIGDIIAFKMPFNYMHLAVYAGEGKVIEIQLQSTLEIAVLTPNIKKRIVGIFRNK